MKNSDYWKQRFGQLEEAQHSLGANAFVDIEKQYKAAQKEIEGQIARWYQRFAKNNNITMAEARQWLKGKDLTEFKWDVKDYIKYGQDNALDGLWMKELENASAKFHISRLEALKLQTQQSLETMFAKQQGTMQSTMQDVLQSGYLHSAYELQKGFNVGFNVSGLDQTQIESILSKPWAVDGYNFSDRIWNNKNKLISEVHTELSRSIMTGSDPQKAIDTIAKKMNTSKYNAGRLVMTEEAYFSSVSQQKCFEDLDVEQYEIVATLDSHTSEICQSLDGQHFPMKDYQAGVTAPPFHPNCRSTTVPYFDDNFGQFGERAARDEKTGETYYVPDDISYPEWKNTFVDGKGDLSVYDVYDSNGTIHYKKPTPPEPTPTPKKEYLTEKKLKAKIADADVQIEDIEKEMSKVLNNSGVTLDKVKQAGGIDQYYSDVIDADKFYKLGDEMQAIEDKYGGWDELIQSDNEEDVLKYDKLQDEQIKAMSSLSKKGFYEDGFGNIKGISKEDVSTALNEKAQLDSLKIQIDNIEAKKAEWQTKLDEKLLVKQKKALTKQQIELEAQKAAVQKQLDDIEVKSYSGIWKYDVTTADYSHLNIEGKKEYYEKSIATSADPDIIEKHKAFLKQLDELETEGKAYSDVQDELNKIQNELKKVQADLTSIENNGIIENTAVELFTQERKDAAMWAQSTQEADRRLRSKCGEVWKDASTAEKRAIHDYTKGSGKFNRPLSGFEGGWSSYSNKGVGNVDLNYEGGFNEIINTTRIIEKSTYDFDMWLQRGCGTEAIESFLSLPNGTLARMSEAELQQFVGAESRIYAFTSTGVAKGKGFSGSVIMNIYAPEGTQMMYAEPISYFGNGSGLKWDGVSPQSSFGYESEMIIQRGAYFRITKIEKRGGTIFMDLEVHPEKGYEYVENLPEYNGTK